MLDRSNEVLDGVHFALLEVGLSTLIADPRRNAVEDDMTAVAVDVQRRGCAGHRALAMKALHGDLRFLKPASRIMV